MKYLMRIILAAALVLGLFAWSAKADSVPTWHVIASGTFTAGGGSSESFNLDWTVTFVSLQGFSGVFPTYSGTTSMSGILGTFTTAMSNAFSSEAEGFLGFWGPDAQAEIDIVPLNYYPYGPTPLTLKYVKSHAPVIGVPYIYSCSVPAPCADYGTTTGIGLFAGFGVITESAKKVHTPPNAAVPEPSSLVLLGCGAAFLLSRLRPRQA
jgi:hypothetical protein